MVKDLTPIKVLKLSRQPSDYIGSETVYKETETIKGHVSPVRDDYSISIYGERISRMYTVIVEYSEDIKNGDKLIINGEECTVVSILTYSSHLSVTAEKVGV